MEEKDFPALYNMADQGSIKAQKKYLTLIMTDLALLVFGVAFSLIQCGDLSIQSNFNIAGAMLLVLSLLVTVGTNFSGFDKTWYGARAVAESVKSLTWKFVTRTEPFEDTNSPEMVKESFLSRMHEILNEKSHLHWGGDSSEGTAPQVTNVMLSIRSNTVKERIEKYVDMRIKNQRDWYSKKSGFHRTKQRNYFICIVISQVLAIGAAIAIIKNPGWINLTGLFSTLSIAFFTWLQINKHGELSQVYSLTAQELGFVEGRSSNILTEEELSDFVSDAENAISREHTMWVARRDN